MVRLFQQRTNNSHGHVHAHAATGAANERSADRSHGHNHGHNHGHIHGGHVEQIELLIDEKCRILNKTGTPKSSALHLANWMKGQLDKQQQQARLAAIARSQENVSAEDEQLIFNSDSEQDERITYWTRQQLEKRTKELNLAKENGGLSARPNFGGKRLSGVEELSMSATSDIYSTSEAEGVTSVISQSHSTTSDSQITVRSSPIVLDKLAVCRHCHKNCQQSGPGAVRPGGGGGGGGGGVNNSSSTPVLLCNSLKVQHSQSSPNRCCKLSNGIAAGASEVAMPRMSNRTGTGTGTGTGSVTSMSSSTITGELSSKVVASSSRRETGDTESDVAQLITDEISQSQSEATDDSVGAMPNSSSSAGEGIPLITGAKLRHLDPPASVSSLPNGHCSAGVGGTGGAGGGVGGGGGSPKPLPPPRRTRVVAQLCQEPPRPKANQQVKAIVTITETARIMRSSPTKGTGSGSVSGSVTGTGTGSGSVGGSPGKYAACHCRCTPEDFTHAQLSPDKMEQQTCKLLESPKQTTTTLEQKQEDEQLSLMLIGLAQLAPAATLCGQERLSSKEENGTPTIAVVPPTPDSVLTKTSTHVWDNSGCSSNGGGTSTTSTATTTTKQPRQAIIENIPEDSCDESPLDEEPPYRPMSSALRRFGTMSSLEKLPSDDRMDEADELDDDLESFKPNGHDGNAAQDEQDDGDADADADTDAGSERALVQNDLGAASSSGVLVNGEVLASGAWTNRAGAYVSDKMSFFEESRAFIDKYLGRWNAGDSIPQQQHQGTASETDEQMDECTSGATSGEEVWGTPTSGGDNDDQDMHLINSENTHSSPTKSSTSLNDDDDTELMMDELLMAPPMTASTIRGLLPRYAIDTQSTTTHRSTVAKFQLKFVCIRHTPHVLSKSYIVYRISYPYPYCRRTYLTYYRRRLEPLFEEETESDEEKTQQDSDDVKKGEATTNGHYLEDSAGSSSDSEAAPPAPPPAPRPVVPDREEDPSAADMQANLAMADLVDQEEQEDSRSCSVERLHPNLATSAMGPRPLLTTRLLPTTAIDPQPQSQPLPPAVLVASSCEYLLDQRPSSGSGRDLSGGSRCSSTTTTTPSFRPMPPSPAKAAATPTAMNAMMTTTTTTTTTMMTTTTMTTTTMMPSRAPSSTTSTISSASDTTSSGGRASGRPPRFVPPPPPPRRLLLTQTDLVAGPAKTEPPRRRSGATADSGCSVAAGGAASASDPIATGSRTTPSMPPSTSSLAGAVAVAPKRPSSTIIETCLLGAPRPASATSSATASRMAKCPPIQIQSQPQPPPRDQSCPAAAGAPSVAAPDAPTTAPMPHAGCGLSPRLEMRLALNHDILGDEDLICYEPGPDLTTILGHDLSTFHRLTGRDLLSRSATNRVQPKEAVISYSQHRNSKMDTPTVNRRPRPLSAGALGGSTSNSNANNSRSSSSSHGNSPLAGGLTRAGVDPAAAAVVGHQQPGVVVGQAGGGSAGRAGGGSGNGGGNSTACSSSRGGSKLGDLEILARREKIYSMSQSRSGCRVRETTSTSTTTTTTTTTLMAMATEMRSGMDSQKRDSSWPKRAAAAASLTRTRSSTSMDGAGAISTTTTTTMTEEAFIETEVGRSKRLMNFIKRRNSEITASSTSSTPNFSDGAFGEQPHPSHSQSSLLLQKLPTGQSLAQDSVEMAAQMSPRKDNDKPSLNRRLWKQITKRRRTNSVSQIVAG
ncbi:serine-rich adhesin for platelets-like [Drosophila teissieri]|uniref:serine-rich adhesin for platelets-like n=1 Tax=Drosophila teissieri TaxID=7243 RepID=UPI001CBA4970|nr:serine-rich adhesin for platelets-like [Drosophila teissieri]